MMINKYNFTRHDSNDISRYKNFLGYSYFNKVKL